MRKAWIGGVLLVLVAAGCEPATDEGANAQAASAAEPAPSAAKPPAETPPAQTPPDERSAGRPSLAAELTRRCTISADAATRDDDTDVLVSSMIDVGLATHGEEIVQELMKGGRPPRCVQFAEAAQQANLDGRCPALCAMQARFPAAVLEDVSVPRSTSTAVLDAGADVALFAVAAGAVRDSEGRTLLELRAGRLPGNASAALESAIPAALGERETLLLLADVGTPWRTVEEIALAARAAGVERVGLITLGERLLRAGLDEGHVGFPAVDLNPAFDEVREATFDLPARIIWLELTAEVPAHQLWIARDGFWLLVDDKPLKPSDGDPKHGATVPRGRADDPLVKLHNRLVELADAADTLGVRAGADTPLHEVVAVLDAVRDRREGPAGEKPPFASAQALAASHAVEQDGRPLRLFERVVLLDLDAPMDAKLLEGSETMPSLLDDVAPGGVGRGMSAPAGTSDP